MSYSAESSVGRRASAGLFKAGKGLPSAKDIHRSWLTAGCAALDESGAILSINDEMALWLGLRANDLVGQNLGEVLGKKDADCAKKFVELRQVGGAFAQGEVAASRAEAEWFSIETTRTGNS